MNKQIEFHIYLVDLLVVQVHLPVQEPRALLQVGSLSMGEERRGRALEVALVGAVRQKSPTISRCAG
jgi:hypothetical protein